jgi:hypothetical protein
MGIKVFTNDWPNRQRGQIPVLRKGNLIYLSANQHPLSQEKTRGVENSQCHQTLPISGFIRFAALILDETNASDSCTPLVDGAVSSGGKSSDEKRDNYTKACTLHNHTSFENSLRLLV